MVVREYPDGAFEVTVVRRPSLPPAAIRRRCSSTSDVEPRERTAVQKIEDFERNAARARATVRRLIQAAGLDHMLTLTYRENRTDARECAADLTRFLRLVRNSINRDYPYVAVFERQKRGAGHWHLAVSGWQPVPLLRALWLRIVGDGNIDVRPWNDHGRPSDCSAKLASYLSKYITKKLADRHETPHRYRRSHNIRVMQRVEESDETDLEQAACRVLARLTGRPPAFLLESSTAGDCFVWACSWGRPLEASSTPLD